MLTDANDIVNLLNYGKTTAQLSQSAKQTFEIPVAFRDTTPVYNGRSNANQTGTTRFRLYPQNACQDLRLAYANQYANGNLVPNTNSISVKASVEINGVIIPVWFQGKRTVTIDAGAIIWSDPIGCNILATDAVYVRTYFDAGAGGYIPTTIPFYSLEKLGGIKDGVTYGSDLTDSGSITDAVTGNGYGPREIFGKASRYDMTFLLSGDSIIDGTGDDAQNAVANAGFAARYMYTNKLHYSKISTPGDLALQFIAAYHMRAGLFTNHTHVICNYGRNDLGSTIANIKARLLSIWKYFYNHGLKVYHTTITPRTTSTDNWMTLENQTLHADETKRAELNAWLKDASASGAIAQSAGTLYKVIDVAAKVTDEATGKWKVKTSPEFSGVMDSAAAGYFNDSALPYGLTEINGIGYIKIISGTGAGQIVKINNNTYGATRVYTMTNFSPVPDNTSTYEVWATYTADGTHPNMIGVLEMMTAIQL